MVGAVRHRQRRAAPPMGGRLADPAARWEIVERVKTVAQVEGPVHIEVVQQRLREAWGIGRIGQRIRANIRGAIANADVTLVDDFIDIPARAAFPVRTPAPGAPARPQPTWRTRSSRRR